MLTDEPVISTNDDASQCKRHAVSIGYWKDPFIVLLSKQATRKTPEISRGYFARVYAVRSTVEQFVKLHDRKCQIISLGSGFDTLFWNLHSHGLAPDHFVEIDFPAVTRSKTMAIQAKKDKLLQAVGEDIKVHGNKLSIIGNNYSLLPIDIRDQRQLESELKTTSVDFTKPTLFIAECVLMYLPSKETDSLLAHLGQKFTNATFLSYDVNNMNDRFAEVMLKNLGSRQCTLHTRDCQNTETQISRFQRTGWKFCDVYGMDSIYDSIPTAEKARVERIEMLDEVHLLKDLMSHYCICLASNSEVLSVSLNEPVAHTL